MPRHTESVGKRLVGYLPVAFLDQDDLYDLISIQKMLVRKLCFATQNPLMAIDSQYTHIALIFLLDFHIRLMCLVHFKKTFYLTKTCRVVRAERVCMCVLGVCVAGHRCADVWRVFL